MINRIKSLSFVVSTIKTVMIIGEIESSTTLLESFFPRSQTECVELLTLAGGLSVCKHKLTALVIIQRLTFEWTVLYPVCITDDRASMV